MFMAMVLIVVVVAVTTVVVVEVKAAVVEVEAAVVEVVGVEAAVVEVVGVEAAALLWIEKVGTVVETTKCLVVLLKLFGSFGRIKPGNFGSSRSSSFFIRRSHVSLFPLLQDTGSTPKMALMEAASWVS